MKKILNISVIAALAISPLAANADPVTGDPLDIATNPPTGQTAENVTAGVGPKYQLAEANANVDGVVATAGYVKGAYNSAIKAINRVSDIATNATNSANISYDGTISGLSATNVKAAIDELATEKADANNVYTKSETYTKTEVDNAITNGAVQSVTTGTTSGTVNVDNQEVAVAGWSDKQNALNTDQMAAVNSGIDATKRAAYDQLVTASGNYATKTGVETTVTNAFTNAVATITNDNITTGNAVSSATVPVVTTWGATAPAETGIAVQLTQTPVVTNVSGTAAVTSGTVAYPAN